MFIPKRRDHIHSTVTLGVPNMINNAKMYSFASQGQQIENRVVSVGALYYPTVFDGYQTVKDKVILESSSQKDKKGSGQVLKLQGQSRNFRWVIDQCMRS